IGPFSRFSPSPVRFRSASGYCLRMSGIMSRPVNDRDQFERATAHLDPPFAVVDLAAFDANAHDLVRRANPSGEQVAALPTSDRARSGPARIPGRYVLLAR